MGRGCPVGEGARSPKNPADSRIVVGLVSGVWGEPSRLDRTTSAGPAVSGRAISSDRLPHAPGETLAAAAVALRRPGLRRRAHGTDVHRHGHLSARASEGKRPGRPARDRGRDWHGPCEHIVAGTEMVRKLATPASSARVSSPDKNIFDETMSEPARDPILERHLR